MIAKDQPKIFKDLPASVSVGDLSDGNYGSHYAYNNISKDIPLDRFLVWVNIIK